MIDAIVNTFFNLFNSNLWMYTQIVGTNRLLPRCKGIELALWIASCRIHMATPMVEHLWNMHNLFCMLCHPKNKIIVLCSIIFRVKLTILCDQFLLDHKQMANIIDATQHINVKIWLKMWIKEGTAIHIQLILVRIQTIAPCLIDGLGILK